MNEKRFKVGTAYLIGGLLLMMGAVTNGEPWTTTTMSILGFFLSLIGGALLVKELDIRSFFEDSRRLQRNKRGNILFIWIVFIVVLFITAVAFISIAPAFYQIIDATTSMNDFPVQFKQTITAIVTTFALTPLLVILGLCLWALSSSINPQRGTVPLYLSNGGESKIAP